MEPILEENEAWTDNNTKYIFDIKRPTQQPPTATHTQGHKSTEDKKRDASDKKRNFNDNGDVERNDTKW